VKRVRYKEKLFFGYRCIVMNQLLMYVRARVYKARGLRVNEEGLTSGIGHMMEMLI